MHSCDWIGVNHPAPADKFAYFRLDAELPQDGCLTARITAAAHYRLWINGKPVCSGPCMGDQHVWYYDEVDLTPYLIPGVNRFAAQVICLDPAAAVDQGRENTSLIRMMTPDHRHRFALSARMGEADLSTGKADWRVKVDESASLKTNKIIEFLGAYTEEIDFHQSPADWKRADCSAWQKAEVLETVEENPFHAAVGVAKRYMVRPRPIPMLFEREETFVREVMTETGLLQTGKAAIPPHTAFEAVLDAGQEKVTHPAFRVEGGSVVIAGDKHGIVDLGAQTVQRLQGVPVQVHQTGAVHGNGVHCAGENLPDAGQLGAGDHGAVGVNDADGAAGALLQLQNNTLKNAAGHMNAPSSRWPQATV